MRWTKLVIALLLVLGGLIPLALAQCDTQAIQILLNEQTKQVIKNTDDSFRAYEQFNTKQMSDFLSQNQGLLQQSAIFLLVALFAIILFTMSLWSLIKIKREKPILLMISEDMHYQRKMQEAFMRKAGIQPEDVQKEMEIERQKEHQPTEKEIKKMQKEQAQKEKERRKQLDKMQRDYQKKQVEMQKQQQVYMRQQVNIAPQQQYPAPYPYNQQPYPQQQQHPQQQPQQYPQQHQRQPQQQPQQYPQQQQQQPQQQPQQYPQAYPQQQSQHIPVPQPAPQQQQQFVQYPNVIYPANLAQSPEISGLGGTPDSRSYHL